MATLYFNGAVDNDWATLGNWWTDSGFTTQASALPTSSDSVVLSATCDTNSGSEPTVVNLTYYSSGYLGIAVTVTGNATFNGSSYNSGTVNGNATFNDSSGNGFTVNGNATFNDSANNGGPVVGDATFNHSSSNNGNVDFSGTFNDSSFNNGPVYEATFNQSSYSTTNGSSVVEETYANRTPYPIPRGINGSSILGVI